MLVSLLDSLQEEDEGVPESDRKIEHCTELAVHRSSVLTSALVVQELLEKVKVRHDVLSSVYGPSLQFVAQFVTTRNKTRPTFANLSCPAEPRSSTTRIPPSCPRGAGDIGAGAAGATSFRFMHAPFFPVVMFLIKDEIPTPA